ncbi:hypothetical protein QTP86_000149 [Hemibagrus guttatus]|nr:hypothetical protein QTP86_000149 [Hemibagrus guttatus]
MDQLSEEVRQESPWTMMFADDIVICSESREQVEENLERWRFALERRGMKLRKPMVEKMRRDRINSSIGQLKSLLAPEFLNQQPDSKLEKADILEMTVSFLR